MPGYFIEIEEKDKDFLHQFSEVYSQKSYEQKLTNGQLFRPNGVNAAYFQPAVIEEYFSGYKSEVEGKNNFSKELKFMLYMHKFDKDKNNYHWPWACGFQTTYKNTPVLFPFFSASNLVMKSPVSENIKKEHLLEVIKPALEKTNLTFRFLHKENSFTCRLIQDLKQIFAAEAQVLNPQTADNKILSRVIFARSQEELNILKEREFSHVETATISNWIKINSTEEFNRSESSYAIFPGNLI